jgi:PilZ domain
LTDEGGGRVEGRTERRAHDRAQIIIDVFFDGRDATGVASTEDISAGGVFMKTRAILPVGSILLMRIPIRRDKQVVCNAEVVYSDPGHGVGIKFHGLSAEARSLLEKELEDVE